jgi:Family of unknown function (DUF6353)
MKLFSEVLSRGLGRQSLTLQKHSPTILFVGGVAGMIGTTVLASRATLKLQDVVNEASENLEKAKSLEHLKRDDYTEEDRQQDTSIIYIQSAIKVARLYAPAVLLGSASIAMLTKSHDILSKRNAALTAAYAALDKGFREYRERVIEKYGEDEDRILRYDSEKITVKNEETGKKEEIYRVGPDAASIYAKFFDQMSANWSKEPEYNRLFLHNTQRYANDLFNARGHVFLNEVYDMLDIPRTEAGSIVGWIRHPDNDNFVDFGVFTTRASDEIRDFVNGREGSVLLDFNVDGVIYNKIDTPKEAPSWQRS